MLSKFICPVCGGELERNEKALKCEKNHSYDISSKGYVNLLLSNRMNTKHPGDNKMMVSARTEFLSKGYYSHLAEEIRTAVRKYFNAGALLDAGCGEGYYTEHIYRELCGMNADFRLMGIDVSKFACAAAAKRLKADPRCEIAAASVFRLPVADNGADMTVTMFAPVCLPEFQRVIKDGGYLIMAIPAENHLLSLKEAVYDSPYKNETNDYALCGFELIQKRLAGRSIFINDPVDIQNLFSMTPYYYKTSKEGHERLKALKTLETRAEFEVLIYRRKGLIADGS